MAERLSDEGLMAWQSLLSACALLKEQLDTNLEQSVGISLAWYQSLVLLARSPDGRLRMQDLGRAVHLSKSGVSQAVAKMEEAGVVTREHHDEDRRVVFAVITPAGRRLLRRAEASHLRSIHRHFTCHLDESELRCLCSALGKVIERSAAGMNVNKR